MAALSGRSLAEVAAVLTAASLLYRLADDRYAMHDLLRGYAHELCDRMEAAPVRTAALVRLLDYYIATTSAAASLQFPLSRPYQPTAAPRTDPTERRFTDVGAAAAWLTVERENLVRAIDAAEQLTAQASSTQDPPVAEAEHPAETEHPVGERERAIPRTALGIANWRLGTTRRPPPPSPPRSRSTSGPATPAGPP